MINSIYVNSYFNLHWKSVMLNKIVSEKHFVFRKFKNRNTEFFCRKKDFNSGLVKNVTNGHEISWPGKFFCDQLFFCLNNLSINFAITEPKSDLANELKTLSQIECPRAENVAKILTEDENPIKGKRGRPPKKT